MGMNTVSTSTDLAGWVPSRVEKAGDNLTIAWCWADGARFDEPFWTESISRLLADQFRLLFQHTSNLEGLRDHSERHNAAPPVGFVFHLSRCGSTLVGQALGSIPGTRVLSEPAPLDQLLRAMADRPEAEQVAAARWMVSALSPPVSDDHQRVIIKMDAWQIHFFPILRQAFPDVPWIFLGRDPIEVMVSHQNHYGAQMIPGALPRELFAIPEGEHTLAEYGAHVLAGILRAGVEHVASGGLLVDYSDLPNAIEGTITKHFGMDDLKVLPAVLARDAKNPVMLFVPDRVTKQAKADEEIRKVVARLIDPSYQAFLAALDVQRSDMH
jgi:hypothetical protein